MTLWGLEHWLNEIPVWLWQNGITWMITQEKEMLVAHTANVRTRNTATSRLITSSQEKPGWLNFHSCIDYSSIEQQEDENQWITAVKSDNKLWFSLFLTFYFLFKNNCSCLSYSRIHSIFTVQKISRDAFNWSEVIKIFIILEK